jgi:ATP/maltotriose-dependent transcriptional regulator MalT
MAVSGQSRQSPPDLDTMDLSEVVKVFVMYGEELCILLRRQGSELSEPELHRLKAQLHLVEMEATKCQPFKSTPS